jgi:membrane-associated protein
MFFDVFMHLDKYMDVVIRDFGVWTYLLLFMIIFCETGLVVTPILPGDSLLFAVGTFAAMGSLDVSTVFVLLSVAAVVGDSVNYGVGRYVGPKVFTTESRFLKKRYMDMTNDFYARHGNKTIILARFVPIIRTFAPFLAGIGEMSYGRFITYNVVGGLAWIGFFIFAGYFFGSLPVVKDNFSTVILIIIILSVLLGVSGFIRRKKH